MPGPDHPSAAGVPVLTTERLILRGHTAADYKSTLALWGDARVTLHISGRPSTARESWARLLNYAGHWALMGFGYWLVEERESGRFLGEVGLAEFKRDIKPGFDGAPEAGWVLAPAAHGKGYATEAMRAVFAWAGQTRGAERYVCIVDPKNTASIKVAEKCGFTLWTETEYLGTPAILMERPPKT
ncbi:GNAT family N-acetyltransferase [Pelagibius sp.]|uniref:GNAT family N-acetyltransferase n=1 Tax=Pelagibius sp. TaxID=1931238 RepID=UPI003B511F5A